MNSLKNLFVIDDRFNFLDATDGFCYLRQFNSILQSSNVDLANLEILRELIIANLNRFDVQLWSKNGMVPNDTLSVGLKGQCVCRRKAKFVLGYNCTAPLVISEEILSSLDSPNFERRNASALRFKILRY